MSRRPAGTMEPAIEIYVICGLLFAQKTHVSQCLLFRLRFFFGVIIQKQIVVCQGRVAVVNLVLTVL